MATLFDVEVALAAALGSAFFAGEGDPTRLTPSTVQLSDGSYLQGRVCRGWPLPDQLGEIEQQGGVHVSIYATPVQRVVPRFNRAEWEVVSPPSITMMATVSGRTVTLMGQGGPGQVVGIAVGQTGYSVRLAQGASPAAVAASLAAMIPGAVATGPSVVLSGSAAISAGVVADTIMIRPLQTQVQRFLVNVWAPSDTARIAVQAAVPPAILRPDGFTLSDSSQTGPAVYRATNPLKQGERDAIFCAQNSFDIEYTTTETSVVPGVLFVGVKIADVKVGIFPPDPNAPPPGSLRLSAKQSIVSILF